MTPEIPINALPIYLDGSDGSIWASRDTWAEILTVPGLAHRRFVRTSDLVQWLQANKVAVADLPPEPVIEEVLPDPPAACPVQAVINHSTKFFQGPDAPLHN